MRVLILLVASVLLVVGGWMLMYPEPSDPKNVKYILWKAGFHTMNVDLATGTMIGDPSRDDLVIGKTKGQIRDRFGSLLSPAEATPYLRACYLSSDWRHREVLFIRTSPWMIVFDGDRATDLVLIKGC